MKMEKYLEQFQETFATELGKSLYCHFYDRQKHYQEPMPDPDSLAYDFGQLLATKFINEHQNE